MITIRTYLTGMSPIALRLDSRIVFPYGRFLIRWFGKRKMTIMPFKLQFAGPNKVGNTWQLEIQWVRSKFGMQVHNNY